MRHRDEAMSLSLYGVPDGQPKGQSVWALPIRILTDDGARVALQRCPILRAGAGNSSTTRGEAVIQSQFSTRISSGFLNEATNTISSGFLREATGIFESLEQIVLCLLVATLH
jgi:hypothetical protein